MLNFLNDIFSLFGGIITSIATYPVADGVTLFSFLAGGVVIILLIKFFFGR